MRSADLDSAVTAIRDGGWGERRAELSFYIAHERIHPFVAEVDDEIIGTGVAVEKGPVGWVGLVFVAPSWRGTGLGRRLTQTTIDRLHGLGCRSVVLTATELGRPIYERLGFVAVGEYATFAGPPLPTAPEDRSVQTMTAADLNEMAELDAAVTGEDRASMLGALAQGWVLRRGEVLVGYAIRSPWGHGPAVASDMAAGAVLLDVLRGSVPAANTVPITVPTANDAAMTYLRSTGYQEMRRICLCSP
jgi:predicted N-acetyltransferase YhbS